MTKQSDVRFIILGILFVILAMPAHAQPAYEADGRQFAEPWFDCPGEVTRAFQLPPDIPFGTLLTDVQMLTNFAWAPGISGLWGMSFDRGGKYRKQSGFPTTQHGTFYHTITMALLGAPGPYIGDRITFADPLVYRAGDWITIAAGCNGTQTGLWPLWELRYKVPFGTAGVPQYAFGPLWHGTSWKNAQTVSADQLGGDGLIGVGASVRNLTMPIAGSWSKVKVTFISSKVGTAFQNCSIGTWTGAGPNTITTPIELFFTNSAYGGAGGHGWNTAGATNVNSDNLYIASDWTNFSINTGDIPIVICDMGSAVNSSITWLKTSYRGGTFDGVAHGNIGSPGAYYKVGSSSYNVASPIGFNSAFDANGRNAITYSLYSVEVQ